MLRSIFTKALYDDRRTLLAWSLALLGTCMVYVAGHKQYAEAGLLDMQLPEYLRILMGNMDFGTAEGYLNSTIYTLIGVALTSIFAISAGARAIADEEESGMLDLLVAYPITRTRLVLEKFAALVVEIAVIGLVLWAGVSLGATFAEMDISLVNIAAITTGLTLAGIVVGMVAMAAGALTGSKGLSIGAASGVALAGFLANNMAPLFQGLEDVQRLSPFYYYLHGDPLRNGFDIGGLAVLAAIVAALLALALWGLNHRDVRI